MTRLKPTSVFLIALFIPAFAFAQLKQDTKVNMAQALTQPTKIHSIFSSIGLDPTKFSMSQSYSLSFMSFGGQSINQGLYLNTMQYQFSNPLSVYLQIGYQHQPFGSLGQQNLNNNRLFISRAGLEFKPSDNFKMQFEFEQSPNSYYNRYNRLNRSNVWMNREEGKR